MRLPSWIFVLPLLALVGCAGVPQPKYREVGFTELPCWAEDDLLTAANAFSGVCESKKRDDWSSACSAYRQRPPATQEEARRFFESEFIPYELSADGNVTGKFTGYYECQLFGSKRRHGPFQTPIYTQPNVSDLPERQAIDLEGIPGEDPILWVDDSVENFFMHIQGSGRVSLVEGGEVYLGYAGSNKKSYVGIGKVMKDQGLLVNVSAPGIKDWLRANPEEGKKIMWCNPSYVFFKERPKTPAPPGSLGVMLTPERSLAVDNRYVKAGAPVLLETQVPATPHYPSQKLCRLMAAQDTGGAIKGIVRGDVFFGYGPKAEELAGYMNAPGRYWVLLPRDERR